MYGGEILSFKSQGSRPCNASIAFSISFWVNAWHMQKWTGTQLAYCSFQLCAERIWKTEEERGEKIAKPAASLWMWNKGTARLTQIHLLSQELQLLLRSTRRGSREGAEGAANQALLSGTPSSALTHLTSALPWSPTAPKRSSLLCRCFRAK